MVFGPPTLGDALTGNAQYSNLELTLGHPTRERPIRAFRNFLPSRKKPTRSLLKFGNGGVDFGVHLVVTAPMLTAATTSVAFTVVTSSATAALISTATNIIASRTLSAAQLAIAGAHYFIPVAGNSVLEFLRWYAANAGGVATTGSLFRGSARRQVGKPNPQ